ncbi:MAG: DNA polymerase [Candidatus Poribacteria bacterium]
MIKVIDDNNELEKIIPDLESMPLMAIDTETTGLDPYKSKVLLFQIGDLEKQFIIDCRKVSIEPLRKILESDKPKVLQNAKFDYKMVKHSFKIDIENMVDTMLIEQVLMAGKAGGHFGLDDLVEKYLDVRIDKSERVTFINHSGDFTERQLEYAQNDLIYTLRVLENQLNLLVKENLQETAKLECMAVNAFADIEYNGMLLDKDKWSEILQEEVIKRKEAGKLLDNIFKPLSGDDLFGVVNINYDSDEQLKDALNRIGIAVSDTSKATISHIDHKISQAIFDYREHQKVVSAYGKGFLEHIHSETGRIHPTFRQLGASSGRTSCADPNLQNIKVDSRFRGCFIAPPGRKLAIADYSGCELRIIAELSDDTVFLETFRTGGDLHSIVASSIFKKNVSKTENPELRQKAKTINFGLAYGMGSQGLAASLEISEKEAEELLENYFKSYPKVKKYLEESASMAIKQGYSATIGGRRRYYEIKDKNDQKEVASIVRQAKNAPIQGTNADMTKLALIWIRNKIKERNIDAKLINTVHDEIVIECAAGIADEAAEIMRDCMVKAGEYYLHKLPVEVEYAISDSWQK